MQKTHSTSSLFLLFVIVFALGWCYCPEVMQETVEVKVWELALLCLLLFLKLPKSLLTAIRILREWNVWILDKEKGWIRECERRWSESGRESVELGGIGR